LVFDGVRLLDVKGPLEVFDVAASLGTGYEVTSAVHGLDRGPAPARRDRPVVRRRPGRGEHRRLSPAAN
jgi:hypothetical protein